jgi:diacylglycerol kinase (ATP)
MQAVFILNASKRNKASIINKIQQAALQHPQITVRIAATTHHNHAIALAAQAAEEKVNFIIAVGGDGTLNQVVNGVLGVNHQIAIGIIPNGSGNDFIKNFEGNTNLSALFSLMQNNSTKAVDAGLVHFYDEEGQEQQRYFMNVADAGMGAEVVKRVNSANRKYGAKVNYMKAIVATFLRFKKKMINVETKHWQWTGEAMAIVAANGKCFAGGLGIAPDAVINDGRLHVTILGKISVWDYIKNIGNLKRLKKIRHKEIHYKEAETINLSSSEKQCGLEADGEFFGNLPVKIEILKNHVRFLAHP